MSEIHPRTILVRKAENDLRGALLDVREKYGLTSLEELQVVQRMHDEIVGGYIKHAMRYERHGNYDTPADVAGPPPRPTARFRRKA